MMRRDDYLQLSRRQMMHTATAGVSSMALQLMLAKDGQANSPNTRMVNLLEARPPMFPASVDRMIFLFQYGSPSQVDTFDYKPELQRRNGQSLPDSYLANPKIRNTLSYGFELMASPFRWKQHGESGQWISELFPNVAKHADELCVIRSMVADSNNHAPASLSINTGALIEGKPSLGSWITYGLGTENQNLPGFVVLYDVGPYSGSANYKSGFLPTALSATHIRHRGVPILDLVPPEDIAGSQRKTLDLVQRLNRLHLDSRPQHASLSSRIESYELAYRMQYETLEVGDLNRESDSTQRAYGLHEKETADYGRMCLIARRLVEKGVRVVQIFNGVANPKEGWDAHVALEENHRFNAKRTDQPIAALLADLKARGLLERTLVVWCGEFGRLPMFDSGSGRKRSDAGRNHNALAFSMWMAGGGVQGGNQIGATDELGLFAEQNPFTIRDLHTTILHGFGLDANDLVFPHAGRDERIIGVAGDGQRIDGVFST
jgi:hypothetical protein